VRATRVYARQLRGKRKSSIEAYQSLLSELELLDISKEFEEELVCVTLFKVYVLITTNVIGLEVLIYKFDIYLIILLALIETHVKLNHPVALA
jgi:hypothetical protein